MTPTQWQEQRKIGIFTISTRQLKETPEQVFKLLQTVLIFHMNWDPAMNASNYWAWGEHFGPVPEGETAPSYPIDVTERLVVREEPCPTYCGIPSHYLIREAPHSAYVDYVKVEGYSFGAKGGYGMVRRI